MDRSALGGSLGTLRPKLVKLLGWYTPLVAARVRLRGRSVAPELGTAYQLSDSWVIALGWKTWIERKVGEHSPRETLDRAGATLPEALYLDSFRLPSLDLGWHEIEQLRVPESSRCLVAAPFEDSIFVVPEGPMPESEADYRRFRLFPTLHFAMPFRRAADPRELREYLLLRWTDPKFFREKVLPYRESSVGWGEEGPVDPSPIQNTYACLYFVSMVAREAGWTSARDLVEIGGGFGNLARVAAVVAPEMLASHTIVDLPHMVRLQRWFLDQEFPGQVSEPNQSESGRFRFVDIDHFDDGKWTHDIVVATESLTELDPAQVNLYLDRVILPSKLVLLVMTRLLFDSPIPYDWVIKRMLDEGFSIRNVHALWHRNFVAVVLSRD